MENSWKLWNWLLFQLSLLFPWKNKFHMWLFKGLYIDVTQTLYFSGTIASYSLKNSLIAFLSGSLLVTINQDTVNPETKILYLFYLANKQKGTSHIASQILKWLRNILLKFVDITELCGLYIRKCRERTYE